MPLWARAGDGDFAFRQFDGLLQRRTLPNLFDLCGPFQIDGNFGASAGVMEMLLQSQLTVAAGILPAAEPGFQPGGESADSKKNVETSGVAAGSPAGPDGKMPPSTAGRMPAATSGIRILDLLPALPKAWPNGSVKGLRARGGFEVDIAWRDGKLASAIVRSDRKAECRIRYGGKAFDATVSPGRPVVLSPEL
jgi:alpha-L-fucosidase 2